MKTSESDKIFKFLSSIPLFSGLPDNEIRSLANKLTEREFQPGEILVREGSSTEHFSIVLDGEVEIIKSLGTPDERIIAVDGKGSLLGEMSMFSRDGSHTASMRARTPSKLLMMTFHEVDELLHGNPVLSYNLLRLFSSRLVNGENQTIVDLREKNRQLTQAYQELQAAQAALIEKEKLDHELQIAGKIQQNILPESMPERHALDFGALMIPAKLVGGDFYDFIPLDKSHIGIVVGDVCDKGIPAALFMALAYSSLRSEAFRHNDPGSTLNAVNSHLLQINRSDMFVTLLYGILDCEKCQFTFARAGHPPPLVLNNHHRPVEIPLGIGQPVGLFDRLVLDKQSVSIPPQGTILIYSDGLSETLESVENSPTLPELCHTILDKHNLKAQEICDQLWRTVGGSGGESLIKDDFTLVCVRNLTPL